MSDNKNLKDFLPNKNKIYYKLFNEYSSKKNITEEEVINCIKTVKDPEIPVNLYDLGLIYNIRIIDNNVEVDMTLTNPNCPVAGEMPKNVGKSIEKIEFLKSIKVKLVWDPKWTKELMTEDAKLALDIF